MRALKSHFVTLRAIKWLYSSNAFVPGQYEVGRSLVGESTNYGKEKRLLAWQRGWSPDHSLPPTTTKRERRFGVWVTRPRLVAANIKPCRLRVWRTTVIHNIVRPRYLRLASLRACLVVRASPPFLLPTSVSLHRRWQEMRERERESRREMFDRLNETLRHTGNIEFPCVQCIRTTRRTIWNAGWWLLSECNLRPVLCVNIDDRVDY